MLPEQCTVPALSAAKDINQRPWRGGRVAFKAAEASETRETAEEAETTGASAAAVRKEMWDPDHGQWSETRIYGVTDPHTG